MTWNRVFYLLALIGLVGFSLPALAADGGAADLSIVEEDRIRITAHLVQVEDKLRHRDVSHLSQELQAQRLRNLDFLREYIEVGEYPRNTHVPGIRPVFIDADGRLCAVGHLMVESGWEEEAQAISERENLQYLLEMTSPEVGVWVEQSGLTAEEAALIQPSYSSCYDVCSCEEMPVCGDDGRTYVNPCFAHHCGRVERWYYGCCDAADEIESSASGTYGFPHTGTACAENPNDRSEELCSPDQAGRVVDEDEWVDAQEHEEEQEADGPLCAMAAQSPAEGLIWVALLAMGLVGLRRKRSVLMNLDELTP